MLDPVQRIVAIPLAPYGKFVLHLFHQQRCSMVTPLPFAIEILEVPVLIIVIASPAQQIPEVGGTVIVVYLPIYVYQHQQQLTYVLTLAHFVEV